MGVTLITDPDILSGYLTDASNVPGHAEGLVRPSTAGEVADVVAHCQAHAIPLTVTAGRTSTTAAAVPQGGWLLSTEALTDVVELGSDRVVAQAGIRLGALQAVIEARGRFYPPDPTSREDCTLGASIATNASGARSFRYGPTRDWVQALRVVLPTGELVDVRRGDPAPADWPVPDWRPPATKTAAGYQGGDWLDLFVGHEGTLGVITQATLRLTALAQFFGFLAYFPSREHAVAFARAARGAARADPDGPVSPRCLEYLDHHCLELARERVGGVPRGARAALFCEQELACSDDEHMAAWLVALDAHGALVDDTVLAADPRGQAELHALRHAIPAGIAERIVRNGMPKVGTDLAVPDAGLDEMLDLYEAAPLDHVLFGHVGDNHLHLNLLPRTARELERARDYHDRLVLRAIELGGTVSAEHGIGKLKRRHLHWMVGDTVLDAFHRLKRHVDPAGILGRGNIMEAPSSL